MLKFYISSFIFLSAVLQASPVEARAECKTDLCKATCTGVSQTKDVSKTLRTELLKTVKGLKLDPSLILSEENPYASPEKFIEYAERGRVRSDGDAKDINPIFAKIHNPLIRLFADASHEFNLSAARPELKKTRFAIARQQVHPDNLKSFYATHVEDYSVTCKAPIRKQDDADDEDAKETRVSYQGKLVVGKSFEDLQKTEKKRASSEFSISLDRSIPDIKKNDAGEEIKQNRDVFQANVALGLDKFIRLNLGDLEDDTFDFYLTPFVQWDYLTNVKANEETDNLAFGLSAKQSLPDAFFWTKPENSGPGLTIGLPAYTASMQYITDIEQFESDQWFWDVNADVLGIDRIGLFVDTFVTMQAVIDHSNVNETGDKEKLAKALAGISGDSFSRLGYNLRLYSKLWKNEDWGLVLDTQLKYRDTFSDANADADLIDVKLSWVPEGESNWSYGLTYERGEKLTTLDEVESWKLSVKYKQ